MNTKEILTQIEAINNRISEKSNPIKCGCDGEWNCHSDGNLFLKECNLHRIGLAVYPADSQHARYHIDITGSIDLRGTLIAEVGSGIEEILHCADDLLKEKTRHVQVEEGTVIIKTQRKN